jgi:HEAT repeat protein
LEVVRIGRDNHDGGNLVGEATQSLIKIGVPAIPALVEIIKNPSNEARTRSQAIFVLGRIRVDAKEKLEERRLMKDAVLALAKVVREPNFDLKWRAIDALEEFGREAKPAGPAVRDFIQVCSAYQRVLVARVLFKIDPDDQVSVRTFMAGLEDKDKGVRSLSAQALGICGKKGAPATETLAKAVVEDIDSSVRLAAANALGRIGAAKSVPPLVAALEDPNALVRGAAAQALGMLGPDASVAVEALLTAIHDEDPSVQLDARRAVDAIQRARRK